MKWLKTLLKKHGVDSELINQITEDVKDSEYVPKSELDTAKATITQLEKDVETKDSELTGLKETSKKYEKLEKDYKTLETTHNDFKSGVDKEKLTSSILKHLPKLNDQYKDDALNKFDLDKLRNEDGTINEDTIKEQATKVIESYKGYFTPSLTGKEPSDNGSSQQQSSGDWDNSKAPQNTKPWNRYK